MNRMNASTRIDLGTKMVENWTSAGHGNNRSCIFVNDMLTRMLSGKGMSPKQREWYDSVVLAPLPEIKNKEQVEILRDAAKVPGMETHTTLLNDFADRLSRGWELSEKQVAFMDNILAKAEKTKVEGPWIPSDDEKKQIELVVGICRRYSSYYLSGRPGLSKSLEQAIAWLSNSKTYLDKWAAEKLMESCKGERIRINKFIKKFPIGSLGFHFINLQPCLILSAPFVDLYGNIVIDVLCNGQSQLVKMSVIK